MAETLTTTLMWRCYEVEMVVMVCQEPLDQQAGMGRMERRDTRERRGTLAHLDLLTPAVEGWSTLAGDEQPALTHREQSWSMQEGLEGPGIITKEEELTTSACLRVPTT